MIKKTFIMLSIVLFVTLQLMGQDIEFLTEENAPFNFSENGEIKGISVDILTEIIKGTNIPYKLENIKILPWARAYDMVQKNQQTILFSMGRTDEREKLFKWVGPIYTLKIGVIAKKTKKVVIGSSSDLNKYIIGTVRDGAPEQLIVKAGANIEKLDRGTALDLNIKKLMSDRIDCLAFNVPAAFYNISKMGGNSSDYEVVYVLKETGLYYGANLSTSDAQIQALQKSLDNAIKNGTVKKITEKYIK